MIKSDETKTERPIVAAVSATAAITEPAVAGTGEATGPEKPLRLVSRAVSGGDYDDVSLCLASIDRDAAVLLLAAYRELLEGSVEAAYLSIHLPFGMEADFLQTADEIEGRFAADGNVEENRASEFDFEIVEADVFAEVEKLASPPDWTVDYPSVHLWRDGDLVVAADFKHDTGEVTSAAIPLSTVAEFFGLEVPKPEIASEKCRIYAARFAGARAPQLVTVLISSPDAERARYQAVIEKIILDQKFRRSPQEVAEIVKKAVAGEVIMFNTVGAFTPEDFAREFKRVKIKEVKTDPYELIHASYA